MTGPDRLRAEIMARFRTGETQVVCNANLVSEGFDAPGCEAVVIAQPGTSLTQYLQRTGRAMRPAVGKAEGVLVDLTGIVHVHGPPDKPRRWTLADGHVREPDTEAVKLCWGKAANDRPPPAVVECGAEVRRSARRCPFCGFVFPKSSRGMPVATKTVGLVDARDLVFDHDLPRSMQGDMLAHLMLYECLGLPPGKQRAFLAQQLRLNYRTWRVPQRWAAVWLKETRARRRDLRAGNAGAAVRWNPGGADGGG